MNIDRLRLLVRGIVDHDDCMEAMKMLSDAKSYQELQEENVKLKKQLENEMKEHLEMEDHLTHRRLRAEDERDQAYLAARRISEEEFLKHAEERWTAWKENPDPFKAPDPYRILNPLGKMMMKMHERIKEQDHTIKSYDGQFDLLNKKYEERDRVVCQQNSYMQELQRELEILRKRQPPKPESEIQADILIDLILVSKNTNGADAHNIVRTAVIGQAQRSQVFHQMMQKLMKMEESHV